MSKFKQILILFTLTPLLFSMGCGDKENTNGQVDIIFKLKYKGEPLEMLKEYTYPDGKAMLFNRVSLFMSDLKFDGKDGITIDNNTHMVNFTSSNSSAAGAAAGKRVSVKGLSTGEYQLLEFCIGVPNELNAKTPADFTNDKDLSVTSEYWPGWKSYIFFRCEGFIDLNGDGVKEQGFALHTGSDEIFFCLNTTYPITITEASQDIEVDVELSTLFGAAPYYDIGANPQIHSLEQRPQVQTLALNIAKGFSIMK